MRSWTCLALILLLSCSVKQDASEAGKEILRVLKAQEASWNEGNVRAFMEGYWKHDSLRFIGKNGISYGWNKVLENYLKGYPDKEAMGTLTFEILDIQVFNEENAWVLGHWQISREKTGSSGGSFTLLFRRINGEWKIVSDHTS